MANNGCMSIDSLDGGSNYNQTPESLSQTNCYGTKVSEGDLRKANDKDVQKLVQDLEQFCASNSLSIKKLQGITKRIPREAIGDSDFLHAICANPRVSRAILKHITHIYPQSASKRRECDGAYPLHVACSNSHCPGSAITLLLNKYSQAASVSAENEETRKFLGMPLHCYMGRVGFKHEFEIVESLVKAHPEALVANIRCLHGVYTPLHLLCDKGEEVSLDLVQLLADDRCECLSMGCFSTPLTSLFRDWGNSSFPLDIVQYFIEHMPHSSVTRRHTLFGNVLHAACAHEHASVEALQMLLNIEGDMIREYDGNSFQGFLPIHALCANANLSDSSSLEMLKLLVNKYPDSVRRWDADKDQLPIHYACAHQSYEFCKYLVSKYPESVLIKTKGGRGEKCRSVQNPFHLACAYGSFELVKYIYELNPESMQEQTSDYDYEYDDKGEYMDQLELTEKRGSYALHLAASSSHDDRKDIVRFILEKDKEAASRVGKWGRLPLHQACAGNLNYGLVNDIFEAYPKAVHTEDMFGRFPIHFAMGCDELRIDDIGEQWKPPPSSKRQTSLVISYLLQQLPYSLNARDRDGRVCAHYACTTSHSLLKMKFIEEKCPDSFKIYSVEHGLPIHMACQQQVRIDIIGNLVRMLPGSLNVSHPHHGLPLACAQDPGTFQMLLSIRYHSAMERGEPSFHSLLLDDNLNRKDDFIRKYVDFSQVNEKMEEFQDDIWRKDKSGRYPLHLIFDAFNEMKMINMPHDLLDHLHMRYEDLTRDIIRLNPEAARTEDSRGWLPLHYALQHDALLKVFNLLLEEYPDGARVEDKQGSTTLHLACRYRCSQDILESLVTAGGSSCLATCDKNGCTPVHIASRHCLSLGSIRHLIELNGSVLTMADKRGELPLHKACRDGNLMLIKELMSRSAPTVSVRNAFNELPVFILLKRAGKKKQVLESLAYVETIWQLLLAHPETVSI